MKFTKNTVKLLTPLLFFMPFSSEAFKIENVNPVDENTLEVSFSEEVNANKTIDLKIIENTDSIVSAEPDFNVLNKVNVELGIPLSANSKYTLISILGVDGNITFELPESFNDLEIFNENINPESSQYIEKIVVVDASNIEVYYYGEVEGAVELKLIKELKTNSELVKEDKKVELKLNDALVSFRPYSLTVADIEAMSGETVSLDDSIVDFEAPEFIKTNTEEYLGTADPEGEIEDLEKTLDVLEKDIENTPEEEEEKSVVEISQDKDKERLPDSWTKENILIMLALMLAFGVAYKNNKNKTLEA